MQRHPTECCQPGTAGTAAINDAACGCTELFLIVACDYVITMLLPAWHDTADIRYVNTAKFMLLQEHNLLR